MLKPGIVYSHEHLPIDLSEVKQNEDCLLDSKKLIIEEFNDLYKKGVRNVINMTNKGMGRNVPFVVEIEDKTGINIVNSTGYYQDKFLPIEVFRDSVSQLASGMVKDIEIGIKGTSIKAGVIGEIATSYGRWTEGEEKVFQAAVIAQKETGVPICTHTSLGSLAHEQALFFERNNAILSKIIIGHVDLNSDVSYIIDILKKGFNIEFDTIGKNNYLSDDKRADMLKEIEKAGYLEQVILSMDISRKSYLKANGGNGYSYLLDNFIPRLKDNGVTEKFINKMLIDNPQRIYGEIK